MPELSLTLPGGKTVSAVGLWMGFAVFFTAIAVQLPILGAWLYSEAFDDPPQTGTRRGIDYIIGFWAFASMSISGYRPRVVGVENLPEGACVYAPNHASFLDILTLTGFVPRPLKYVSKASILKIPFIGWPMQLAEHIPLNQESRRSQLETFKRSVESLEAGNSIVAFPEGSRSEDGVLQPFKRGPFKMAMRAGVPVVPVTISDLARWYPKGTLLPIGVPTDVVVTIHPPIEMQGLVDESAALAQTYDAVNSALPLYQRGACYEEL
jgi:1-acyl-sn-glycerol-3-phosphate acyltransferase